MQGLHSIKKQPKYTILNKIKITQTGMVDLSKNQRISEYVV